MHTSQSRKIKYKQPRNETFYSSFICSYFLQNFIFLHACTSLSSHHAIFLFFLSFLSIYKSIFLEISLIKSVKRVQLSRHSSSCSPLFFILFAFQKQERKFDEKPAKISSTSNVNEQH